MLKVLIQPIIIYTGAFRLIDKTSLLLVTPKSSLLIEVLGQSLPHLIIIIYNLVSSQTQGILPSIKIALSIINLLEAGVSLYVLNHVKTNPENSVARTILNKRTTPAREFSFVALFGSLLTIIASIALIEGFGVRQCAM